MQSTWKGWAAAKWTGWAAAVLSAGLLELPFPIAGPMPPWRGIFAWFALVPLLWAILPHPSGKDKGAARVGHPADEDPSMSPPVGHPNSDERRPLVRAFLLAYVCGVLWYMGNCYWIYDTMLIHGGLPPLVSALVLLLFSLILGLYFGLFGLGLALVRRATGSVRLALVFAPFLWVALELAGARITCVPWDQLGYSQVDNGITTLLAPWTGVYGISFLLATANAALAWSLLKNAGLPDWLRLALQVPGLLVFSFGFLVESPKAPTTATAVLVQPDLDVGVYNNWRGEEWDQHIAQFAQLGSENCKAYIAGMPQTGAPTSQIACPPEPTHPDLIVWPESPAPFFEQDPRFQQSMGEVAQADHAPLVILGVGSNFSASENIWHDYVSALAFDANGAEVGRYDKIHLVPWGEYVPYPQIFFFAKKLTGRVGLFTPGTVRNVFRLGTANGETHRYGVFICYESVFADEVRQFARNGAEVFVNVSDDGWYGDTSAPWQHLNMARMRAIENRRWILRDTNDGVTASIDPYGRVRQSIPRHQVDALPAQYGFRGDITFYTAHGDVFAWMCVAVSLAGVGFALITKSRKSA